jgi:YbaB/EbfC DNA-binding family
MTDRDRFAAQVREDALTRLEAVQEMQRQLQGLVGHGESADRRVVLTVTPTGAITDLRLSHDAMRLSPEQLSAEIMGTAARATAEVSERMKRIVGGLVPQDQLDALIAGDVPDSSRREIDDEIRSWREGGL